MLSVPETSYNELFVQETVTKLLGFHKTFLYIFLPPFEFSFVYIGPGLPMSDRCQKELKSANNIFLKYVLGPRIAF